MDESLQELEAELKSLHPRRPSVQLRDRLDCDLAGLPSGPRYATATNLNSWKWHGWRAAGVAAAVALLAAVGFLANRRPQPADRPAPLASVSDPAPANVAVAAPAAHDRYKPVTATNVLYDLKDEGLVNVDGDAPARRVRYRYLDTYTWKNPKGNASFKWSVPRDEIRVLPASMN